MRGFCKRGGYGAVRSERGLGALRGDSWLCFVGRATCGPSLEWGLLLWCAGNADKEELRGSGVPLFLQAVSFTSAR